MGVYIGNGKHKMETRSFPAIAAPGIVNKSKGVSFLEREREKELMRDSEKIQLHFIFLILCIPFLCKVAFICK